MVKKIIIGFVVFFILLVGIIIAIPFLFKDTINDLLKEQINNELKVSVDYASYDLTIFSSFPDFRFSLNDLIVIGQGKFEGDTLAKMKELNFDLDLQKVIQEEIEIHSITVDELNLKAIILADSSSSLDVMKEKPETETTQIDTSSESLVNLKFESFIVKNSNIFYNDELNSQVLILKNLNINAGANYIDEKADINGNTQISEIVFSSDTGKQKIKINEIDLILKGDYFKEKLNFDTETKISNLKVETTDQNIDIEKLNLVLIGDYLQNYLNLKTNTTISSLGLKQGETNFLNKASVSLNGDYKIDLSKKIYTFIENTFKINQLALNYDGVVKMPDENIDIDLNFESNKASFKELLSIVPNKYLKDIRDTKINGDFNINGYAKGILNEKSYPSFDITMGINNGYFKNNSLPTAVENINLKANIVSPNSDMSQMNLYIPNAKLSVDKEPITFSLEMLNIKDDLFVNLEAKGVLMLKKVPDFYKIEDLKRIDGSIAMDMVFKGKMSDIEKKKFDNVYFQGDMRVRKFYYETNKSSKPIVIKSMDLVFSPQYASLRNFDLTYGNNDIKATGKLENIIGYVLSDATIKGNLDINSTKINLTDLMGEEEKNTETNENTSTKSEKIKVPKNIDFTTNANIKELIYDDIVLKDVKGNLVVQKEAVKINSVTAKMLGGTAKINGGYSTLKPGKPVINFKYDVNNLDIKQTYKYVNTVEKIAPIAKFIDGNFSSDFSFNSLLEDDFTPNMSLISGLGEIRIGYANFLNFPAFKSISNAIKIPALDLNNAAIKNAFTIFKIKDGKVNVEPFDYNYQDIKMKVQGSNGFDKTIDYLMQITVPSDKFGGAASVANNWLSKQNIPLLNLSVPKNITFHINLSGLIANPKVKILKVTSEGSDKGVVEQVKDNVVNKAKEEAEKLKKEAEKRAREEAEKLRKEAEKRAKEAAEKLKNDAAERAKKEAEKLLKDNLPNFGW